MVSAKQWKNFIVVFARPKLIPDQSIVLLSQIVSLIYLPIIASVL